MFTLGRKDERRLYIRLAGDAKKSVDWQLLAS